MVNILVQEPRNLQSTALIFSPVRIAIDTDQILRGTDDPSFLTTFRYLRHAVQETAATLEATFK